MAYRVITPGGGPRLLPDFHVKSVADWVASGRNWLDVVRCVADQPAYVPTYVVKIEERDACYDLRQA